MSLPASFQKEGQHCKSHGNAHTNAQAFRLLGQRAKLRKSVKSSVRQGVRRGSADAAGGSAAGGALVTGHVAIFIDVCYVFSFGPSIPLVRIYLTEILA